MNNGSEFSRALLEALLDAFAESDVESVGTSACGQAPPSCTWCAVKMDFGRVTIDGLVVELTNK